MNHLTHQMMAKAIQLFHDGNLDTAENIFKEVLKSQPKNFDALHILGVVKGIKNQHQQALEYFNKALRINPNNSYINFNIAKAFSEIGEHEKALKYHINATRLNPTDPEGWLSYGKTLSKLNRTNDALSALEKAINLEPNYSEAWVEKGVILGHIESHKEAIASFDKALQINSQLAEAWYNRGNSLQEIQQFEQAIASYDEAIKINPDYAEAWSNRGSASLEIKNFEQSIIAFDNALKKNPNLAEAWSNRGYALFEIGQFEKSLLSSDKALQINPQLAVAWSNRGNALLEIKQFEQAIASYEKALQINPQLGKVWSNLGFALINISQYEKSVACYREALRLEPDHFIIRSDFLFNINYIEKFDALDTITEAKIYGFQASATSIPKFSSWNTPLNPKKLKIGFVSGDLCKHPVGYFIEGLIESLDQNQFELYAFQTRVNDDDLTDRIRPFFSDWISITSLSNLEAAKLIHNKGIHVLIDLSGHSAYNRLPVFSYKPAPVQASWLGYFATTGVPEIDYFIGDPHMSPVSEENQFTEAIWRLPDTWLCLKLPTLKFSPSSLPALTNGFVTFGSFGNLSKVNDQVLKTWASVLHHIPKSKLFLKSKQLGDSLQIARIQQRFNDFGISIERLLLEGPDPRDAYLKAYNKVDLVLDTFPYPGGTTSLDALFMGVPVLTLRGDRFLSHLGESIAINAGNSDWIANDITDYINKAVKFTLDFKGLAIQRETLREKALKSPLFDINRFATNFGNSLWDMWLKNEVKLKD